MMTKKLLFALILVLAFISCDKDEKKLDNKETLIENLDLFQTSWSGTYTAESFGFNQKNIIISFIGETTMSFSINSGSSDYNYTHDKNIINMYTESMAKESLDGNWWIIDITENSLLLHRDFDHVDPNDLDVLELTKIY